ncbi:MAG TPA: hypothetical protein VFY84_10950 [Jiangellales bacterium]|nr:hypothetical protein [Jiangellales bacterium]
MVAGVNTSLRELRGVFGVAVLAAVFAANGGYASAEQYIDGFRAAMVAALVPVLGVIAAGLGPDRIEAPALVVDVGPTRA